MYTYFVYYTDEKISGWTIIYSALWIISQVLLMEELKLELLAKAERLMKESKDSNEVNRLHPLTKKILFSQLSSSEDISQDIPSNKVLHFISSTFEDTQFEQDYMLTQCFPFLRQFCGVLDLDFDVVSMRWGVRARANNDHRTSELCMDELHYCLDNSVGLAYIALQSHRYTESFLDFLPMYQ